MNGKSDTIPFDQGGCANLSASVSSTLTPEALSLAPTECRTVS